MTDNQRAWLKTMYDEEIRQAAGAAENERIWADGAPDSMSRALHAANADEQAEYVKILKRLRTRVDEQ